MITTEKIVFYIITGLLVNAVWYLNNRKVWFNIWVVLLWPIWLGFVFLIAAIFALTEYFRMITRKQ